MRIRNLAGAAALALLSHGTLAADGHDHAPAKPAAAAAALPRFAAASETFELVGVVDGRRLVVWVDRFADNAPVVGATVELDVGGARVALKERAEGELEGMLAEPLKPGVTPVTATIVAGDETDLLAADLDVHADEHSAAATPSWRRWTPWAAAGLALSLAIGWALTRHGRPQATLPRGAA